MRIASESKLREQGRDGDGAGGETQAQARFRLRRLERWCAREHLRERWQRTVGLRACSRGVLWLGPVWSVHGFACQECAQRMARDLGGETGGRATIERPIEQ